MNDAQIIGIGITVLVVLVGTLFSNHRISDLSARIGKLDTIIGMLGHLGTRVTKLEERPRTV